MDQRDLRDHRNDGHRGVPAPARDVDIARQALPQRHNADANRRELEIRIRWIQFVIQTVLQSLQYGTTASLYSFFGMVLFIATVSILYATGTRDSIRLMYAGPITAAITVALGLVLVFFPLRNLWRARKEDSRTAEDGTLSDSTDAKTADSDLPPE
jgi:hypothetical protein